MHFEQPWVLLLLGLVPSLVWFRLWRPADSALRFGSAESAASLRVTLRARLAHLPYWLRVAALCLFVVALARPQSGGERRRETGRGIGIYMVIDRSPSMLEAIAFGGRQTTRLALAKKLLQEFATGDGGGLKGRTSDPIGIVAFARQPETVCPLTFAYDSFPALLSGVQPPPRGDPEAFTAIGDAVALAAARLKNTPDANLRSKVIILLTDGETGRGRATGGPLGYPRTRHRHRGSQAGRFQRCPRPVRHADALYRRARLESNGGGQRGHLSQRAGWRSAQARLR